MGFTIKGQVLVFLFSCVFGLALGALYDLFRLLRKAVPGNGGAVFAEDIAYFLIYAGATFLFLMDQCQGELRLYVLLGQFLGAVLWFCTVSKGFLQFGSWLIRLAKRLFSLVAQLTFCPLLALSRKCAWLLECFGHKMKNILKKVAGTLRIDLKKHRELLYNQNKSVQASSDAVESGKRRGLQWNRRQKNRREKSISF